MLLKLNLVNTSYHAYQIVKSYFEYSTRSVNTFIVSNMTRKISINDSYTKSQNRSARHRQLVYRANFPCS